MGQKWDSSHLLENLSGYETSCTMIGADDWPFTRARSIAARYGLHISEVYGYALNQGSTDLALEEILQGFKEVSVSVYTLRQLNWTLNITNFRCRMQARACFVGG